MLLSDKDDHYSINIGNDLISNSTDEKILGIYFDNKLNFNTHPMKLCKKPVRNCMPWQGGIKQRKIIMNAFIHSQFSYCPLVWMCHCRTVHSLINNIHERAWSIVYNDNIPSFTQLLEKSGSVSIHHRNLQALVIEVYEALNNLSSPLMSDLIKLKETTHNLRNACTLVSTDTKTTNYGINSIYLAPNIWDQVPDEIKLSKPLNIFKHGIKTWIPLKRPGILCKLYVPNLGYTQSNSVSKLIYMQTYLTIQPHIFCILMFIPRGFIFTVLSITFFLLSILISLRLFLL